MNAFPNRLRDRLAPWALAFLLIVFVVLVPAFYALHGMQMRASSLLHADTNQVVRFAAALRNYSEATGSLPGPSLQAAVEALRRFERENNAHYAVDWDLIAEGRTPYGGPFIYEWLDNGKRVRVRSTGPYWADSRGAGGGIAEEVSVTGKGIGKF